MAVIFLFIDGVGLGQNGEENPFAKLDLPGFGYMTRNQPFVRKVDGVDEEKHFFKAVDATLGVEGLPQSGTGQAALFSGENAAQIAGKHFGPFPYSTTRYLLSKESLFHKLTEAGKKPHFINAYPDLFFRRVQKRNRLTCTTLMVKSAGQRLNGEEEVKKGRALTAEITQQVWREQLGIKVPQIKPEQAAIRLQKRTAENDLVLFEYYLTDKTGHAKDMEMAHRTLAVYDTFLRYLIENKREEDTIVLSSDHGNVEDLSVKTHTLNPVPLFVYGPGASAFRSAQSIMDVAGGILRILN